MLAASDFVDVVLRWEMLLLTSVMMAASFASIIAGFLGKKKWKQKAMSVTRELVDTTQNIVHLSQATTGIVLGVENLKNVLPKIHRAKVGRAIREITNAHNVEDLVEPIVSGIKRDGGLLGDLTKFLTK